jgi:hypothetical protein
MSADELTGLPFDVLHEHPDFPRFNAVSTGLRDAEERLLRALRARNQEDISGAKLALMGSLDEYSKVVDAIDNDLVSDNASAEPGRTAR